MQLQKKVLDCYNKTAEAYAEKFVGELRYKHFDRLLLAAFAKENFTAGPLLDVGCGPGQTTRFLYDAGLTTTTGADLSPDMVRIAKKLHPAVTFEVADMLSLPYGASSFGSVIAFYAIVHFTYQQVAAALTGLHRVLKSHGQLLFSFHTGNEVIHHTNFLGHEVDIDFYFFDTEKIKALLLQSGFEMIDLIVREPYAEVEYASRRAYVWVQKR